LLRWTSAASPCILRLLRTRFPPTIQPYAPDRPPVDVVRALRSCRCRAREILTRHAGESVLVVGHSNTVPQIVQALSGRAVAEMTEEEYDHLFVVVVPPQGVPRLFKTRYRAAEPQ
jgi:hypothetical protein